MLKRLPIVPQGTLDNLRKGLFGIFAGCLLAMALAAPGSAAVTSYVVTIDSNTIQPVGTGFVPPDTNGDFVVIVDGAVRNFANPTRYELGWFGQDGQTRLAVAGQPIFDGMPYGGVIGGFNTSIPSYQYYGMYGADSIQPSQVGQEFRVALNMSDSNLAGIEGSVTITVIHIPDGEAEVAQVTLDSSTVQPISTGITVESGDRFIILSYGLMQQTLISGNPLSGGYYGPSGLIGFNRAGQPASEGPYGSLYGSIPGGSPFFLGQGGSFSGQPADVGFELSLLLNMSDTDLTNLFGRCIVNVIRVPEMTSAAPEYSGAAAVNLRSFPNPMTDSARIGFNLAQDDDVRLRVYDAQGRWVRNLVNEPLTAGSHEVVWDGRNDDGQAVSSGLYFYQLSRSSGSDTGRIILSR